MGLELEWKYASDDIQQAEVLGSIGPWHSIQMETTYYDTPDRTLSAGHITLRRRLENGKSICTVKTPVASGGRGEWECQGDNIGESIDALCKLGAPKSLRLLTQAGVEIVCGARFTRQACEVHIGESTAEIAVDKGVLLGGGKELPLCEIEVEFKGGDVAEVEAFAAELASRFHLLPEKSSKFRRALALAEGGKA